jgi:hypothetical protein
MKKDPKEWTLEIIKEVQNEFSVFLENVPPKDRNAKGELKKWSVKDEIAHLAFWFEIFVANIRACRAGNSLISTKNYLQMNDQAWGELKDLTWNEVEKKSLGALTEIAAEIKGLTIEELIEGAKFSVEPHRNPPRPLLKSLLYELIDHPFKHLVKLYTKQGNPKKAVASLIRISNTLKQPGFSQWSANSVSKINKYLTMN